MAKLLNYFRTLRNNWKKSVFGAAALSYGISYSKDAYEIEQLMRQYCEDVIKYGNEPCPASAKFCHVTVILNPAAKRRKAKKLFEKYCEPLLHLAGITVTVIETESRTQTRNLITNLDASTDAIVVAGGDGTLSDVVTAVMRKHQGNVSSVSECPIGVLPLGETNTVAGSLCKEYPDFPDVRQAAESTIAIIKNNTKMMNVIEIEPLQQDPEEPMKPIYSMGTIEWGAWKDANMRANKYWYWGSLRKYAAYVFSGYKTDLNWTCNAVMRYTDPCSGCSRCYHKESFSRSIDTNRRWWHAFVPRQKAYASNSHSDYAKVVNEQCGVFHEVPISTTEISIKPVIESSTNDHSVPALKVQIAPKDISYISFVTEGWRKLKENKPSMVQSLLEAKEIELYPEQIENTDKTFFIDNEDFELRPVRMKLLLQSIKIFCPER